MKRTDLVWLLPVSFFVVGGLLCRSAVWAGQSDKSGNQTEGGNKPAEQLKNNEDKPGDKKALKIGSIRFSFPACGEIHKESNGGLSEFHLKKGACPTLPRFIIRELPAKENIRQAEAAFVKDESVPEYYRERWTNLRLGDSVWRTSRRLIGTGTKEMALEILLVNENGDYGLFIEVGAAENQPNWTRAIEILESVRAG